MTKRIIKRKGLGRLRMKEIQVYTPTRRLTGVEEVTLKKGDARKLWPGQVINTFDVPSGNVKYKGRRGGVSVYTYKGSFWRWLGT